MRPRAVQSTSLKLGGLWVALWNGLLGLGLLGPGLLVFALPAFVRAEDPPFVRGNANGDRGIDIADAVFILTFNFRGGRAPPCLDAADANDDGRPDISDAIFLLNFLFGGSRRPPPAPYPNPGADPTPDSLGCLSAAGDPFVVRHGTFFEREHGVAGDVEELSNRTIRLTHFYYDGGGTPMVVIVLHTTLGTEQNGTIISLDLLGNEFQDATIEYPIPPQVNDSDFGMVSVWCTNFPLNYGYARLFNNS